MFKSHGVIKSKVMSVINSRIAQAEENYQIKCVEIDRVAEEQKETEANTIVAQILSGKEI